MINQDHFSALLMDWLVGKGLQFQGSNLARGGISRGYARVSRSYEYAYTEITGYALSYLLDLSRSGNFDHLDERIQAALDYLLRIQRLADGSADEGALCHSVDPLNGETRPDFYSFDTAMCIQGLVDFYSATGKDAALESAMRAADWLITRMQFPDGSFRALSSPNREDTQAEEDPIFGDRCCLHAKHAIGLLKVWQASRDERYRDAAVKVCDWVLGLQNPDGSFCASKRGQQTASHAHCYATEGLLVAAHCLQADRYLAAARKSGEWLAKRQNKNGSLNIAYNRPVFGLGRRAVELIRPRYVADATAQAIRIWLLLDAFGPAKSYREPCQKAAHFLYAAQVTDASDALAQGGIQYWPGHPILFAWVGMFAHQAQRWLASGTELPFEKMIEALF
jgi:hypothetical protein